MQYADVALATRIAGKDATFTYLMEPAHLAQVSVGVVVEVPWRQKKILGVVTGFRTALSSRGLAAKLRPIGRVLSNGPLLTEQDLRLRRDLARLHQEPASLAVTAGLPPVGVLSKLKPSPATVPASLTKKADVTFVTDTVQNRRELLRRIGQAVAQDKTILLLVPNQRIGDSWRQALLETVDPARIMSYFAAMRAKEQLASWQVAAEQKPGVVIGTRAAVLLPFRQLAAIIIDEPNHSQFQEQQAPYYSVFEVAQLRRSMWGTPIIATDVLPSLASLVTPERSMWRFAKSAQPETIITIAKRDPRTPLAATSLEALTVDDACAIHHALIVVPGANWAAGQICRDCKTLVRCPDCGAILQVLEDRTTLRCAVCRANRPSVRNCPTCRGANIASFGWGSHRWQAELLSRVPNIEPNLVTSENIDTNWQVGIISLVNFRELRPRAQTVIAIEPERLLVGESYDTHWQWLRLLWRLKQAAVRQLIIETTLPELDQFSELNQILPRTSLSQELRIRQRYGYPPFGAILYLKVRARLDETKLGILHPAGTVGQGQFSGWQMVKVPHSVSSAQLSRFLKDHRDQILDWHLVRD